MIRGGCLGDLWLASIGAVFAPVPANWEVCRIRAKQERATFRCLVGIYDFLCNHSLPKVSL